METLDTLVRKAHREKKKTGSCRLPSALPEEGTSGEAVARALGHTRFTLTAKHYASTDSVENARVNRAASALMPSAEKLAELLSQMTPEARADLLRRFPN